MSIPFKHLCGKCHLLDKCHNYSTHDGQEVTLDFLIEQRNVENPCINSKLYKGDYVIAKMGGLPTRMYVYWLSCNIIDDYSTKQETATYEIFIEEGGV